MYSVVKLNTKHGFSLVFVFAHKIIFTTYETRKHSMYHIVWVEKRKLKSNKQYRNFIRSNKRSLFHTKTYTQKTSNRKKSVGLNPSL